MTDTVVADSAGVVEGGDAGAFSCVLFWIQNINFVRDSSREFQSLEMGKRDANSFLAVSVFLNCPYISFFSCSLQYLFTCT